MISAGLEWFIEQQVPLQAAFLSAGTTLLVLFLGVWLNSWANRRNTLKASRDSQKLDIYKNLLEKIDAAEAARHDADWYLRDATASASNYAEMVGQGVHTASLPKQRYPEFSRLHQIQSQRVSEIHRLLEQWSIIDHRLKIFRMAFSYQGDALGHAYMGASEKLIRFLPAENPNGGVYPYNTPQPRHLAELDEASARYNHESGLLSAYIGDLNVELQGLLLGHLFGAPVVRRDPPDPSQFALRLDRHRAIVRHFSKTEFFRRGDELDRKLRAEHGTLRPWWRFW